MAYPYSWYSIGGPPLFKVTIQIRQASEKVIHKLGIEPLSFGLKSYVLPTRPPVEREGEVDPNGSYYVLCFSCTALLQFLLDF